MHTISLDGIWKLYYFPQGSLVVVTPEDLEKQGLQPIPAQVPGNVELDLMKKGLLKDPYVGSNILALKPLEKMEWWYQTQFKSPDERGSMELVFHGADCSYVGGALALS
jgi:beta-mannosidase